MSEGLIDLTGLDKAEVAAALYNNSKPQGLGFIDFNPEPMTVEQVRSDMKKLGEDLNFGYWNGRVMKTNLNGSSFDPWCYDRDNGQGAAARAIKPLLDKRSKGAD